MSQLRTLQDAYHWLEAGIGARWIRLAAVLLMGLVISLLVAWKQFHGPLTEGTLLQADMGRQLARGQGFTTLVNYPQVMAVLEDRGIPFSPEEPYPEVYQAPLYSLLIAGGLHLVPESVSDRWFAEVPVAPGGFGGDYFLLGLSLVCFWIAIFQTYNLGARLFAPRVGWLAALALLLSVAAWQQIVAVNGVPLMMVLALAAFRLWVAVEDRSDQPGRGWGALVLALGVTCGLLFLSEYSTGFLVLVATAYLAWRGRGRTRVVGPLILLAGFLVVSGPWVVRNLRLTGLPTGLAIQNVALKAGDPTAEPATFRGRISTELPEIDLNKLGNKALTSIQDNVKTRLWSGGIFLTAFFVAGWIYTFRSATANRLRWMATAALAALIAAQAFFNSGESERLPVLWLAPLIMIFGAGFFHVLLDASPGLSNWPRLAFAMLLVLQALPLVRDALEPRRLHFNYPPYFPGLFVGMRQELEVRGALGRFSLMADVPAGAAWYGDERVWAQPSRLRDFYAIMVEQPVAELLLTPATLDRPFFSELAARGPGPAALGESTDRFGEWGQVYSGLVTGRMPSNFPLRSREKLAENLYVLLNPSLPQPRGNELIR